MNRGVNHYNTELFMKYNPLWMIAVVVLLSICIAVTLIFNFFATKSDSESIEYVGQDDLWDRPGESGISWR